MAALFPTIRTTELVDLIKGRGASDALAYTFLNAWFGNIQWTVALKAERDQDFASKIKDCRGSIQLDHQFQALEREPQRGDEHREDLRATISREIGLVLEHTETLYDVLTSELSEKIGRYRKVYLEPLGAMTKADESEGYELTLWPDFLWPDRDSSETRANASRAEQL